MINCLLDTGARINVISEVIFQKLIGLELRESKDILRCANNSQLLILGKTTNTDKQNKKMVEFVVVKEMNPELIGGIELQEQFGFRIIRNKSCKRLQCMQY